MHTGSTATPRLKRLTKGGWGVCTILQLSLLVSYCIQGLLFTFKFKNPFLLVLKAIVDDNTGLMLIERTNRTQGEKQL